MTHIDERLARQYEIIEDALNLFLVHLGLGLKSTVPDVTIDEINALIEVYRVKGRECETPISHQDSH